MATRGTRDENGAANCSFLTVAAWVQRRAALPENAKTLLAILLVALPYPYVPATVCTCTSNGGVLVGNLNW